MYYIILLTRYMKRRCEFLDNLPAFNYNTGAGEFILDKHYQQLGMTDTRQLGSTLMRAMLKEVSDFCDPTIKANGSKISHELVGIQV